MVGVSCALEVVCRRMTKVRIFVVLGCFWDVFWGLLGSFCYKVFCSVVWGSLSYFRSRMEFPGLHPRQLSAVQVKEIPLKQKHLFEWITQKEWIAALDFHWIPIHALFSAFHTQNELKYIKTQQHHYIQLTTYNIQHTTYNILNTSDRTREDKTTQHAQGFQPKPEPVDVLFAMEGFTQYTAEPLRNGFLNAALSGIKRCSTESK